MWLYVYYQKDWGFPPTILHDIYYILPSQEDFLFCVYKSIIMATCSTTRVATCCSHKNNQDS